MKLNLLPLLAVGVLFSQTGIAQAQISWGAIQTITGNSSDISTTGTFFDAIDTIRNGTFVTTTVGDTTFNGLSLDSNPSDGTISDVATGGDGNFHGVGAPSNTNTPDNTAYGYAINQASDASSATVTIGSALHPLTVGATYQVQVWSFWGNTNYGAELDNNAVVFPNGGGGFVLGTFTAGSTTQTFTYGGNAASFGAGFVSDIAVREVPEPSTYALIFAGLAFVGLLVRRQSVRA